MHFLSCGDVHGRNYWKTIDPAKYDKIIFVGDYLDSFNVSNSDILSNLFDLIEFKKTHPDKVVLLLGNHDLWYWFGGIPSHRCSGVRPDMLWDVADLFIRNRKLFQVAYQYENYIWSHAGIHIGWYKNFIENKIEPGDINLADTINRLFEINYKPLFNVSWLRGGVSREGGIFWADKRETCRKPLPGYHQIVGHSPVSDIKTITVKYKKRPHASITYVDCLHKVDAIKNWQEFNFKLFYELEIL